MKTSPLALAGAVLVASMSPTLAAGLAVSTGTAAPPTTLGAYTLSEFSFGYDDPRSGFVSDVPSPLGGSVVFGSPLEILKIGVEWESWSHGFDGDVYAVDLAILNPIGQYEVTLELPPETGAFLFYAEPAFDGLFTISATLDDGTSLSQEVAGFAGATGFGFLAPLGAGLSSIRVLSEIPNVDFAIGEFRISGMLPPVPEPGTAAAGLLALGLVGGAHRATVPPKTTVNREVSCLIPEWRRGSSPATR